MYRLLPMKTFRGLLISLLVFLTAIPSWAAITYVGGQTGSFVGIDSSATGIAWALAGGSGGDPIAGDLVIATYCVAGTTDIPLLIRTFVADGTVSYDVFGTEQYANDSNDTNAQHAYRFMPATPDASGVAFTTSSGNSGTGSTNNAGAYAIHVFRGVHATPLEQAVQQGTATDSLIINPGSITPTTAGTVVYVAGCSAMATTNGTYTSSDLTDFLTSTTADTVAASIGSGYFEWTSGAFAPATFGLVGVSDSAAGSYAWMIVALAPAADAAAVTGMTGCGAAMILLGKGAGC